MLSNTNTLEKEHKADESDIGLPLSEFHKGIKERPLISLSDFQETIDGSGLPIIQAASVNQNVANKIPREKPEVWSPCLPHRIKHGNKANDWWMANKKTNPKKSNKSRGTFFDEEGYQLQSQEANCISQR